jgi:hypothetical protein
VSDLDTAIRRKLADYDEGDPVGLPIDAIEAVLERCARLDQTGDPLMSRWAHAFRRDIADALDIETGDDRE